MDVLKRLSITLADRYQVEREIGAGGMATVYLARDLRHNRKVALKVLHPELSAVLGSERFLKEIELTASLQHPHILPLFDSGAADGLLFYVMPYVEGESLRARLNREGPLPVHDAIRLATEIAGALGYAQSRGLVHRDIKPENILLQQGQALLSDFGIALAVQTAGSERMTQTGLSLGTPHYMAPEQVMGERAVDVRADVYALGAVTYEMLAGEPPFSGPNTPAILSRVLTERPRSVRVYRPQVPSSVELALERALEKLPADRWQSATEFVTALTDGNTSTRSIFAGESGGTRPLPGFANSIRATAPWAVAATAVMLAVWAPWTSRRETPAVPVWFVLSFPDTLVPAAASGTAVAVSPAGTDLAFVGRRGGVEGIYVRGLEQLEAGFVRGTEGAVAPDFSPDGGSISFVAGGELRTVPLTGGAPTTLVESPIHQRSWTDKGELVYRDGTSLWRLPSDGSTPILLAAPDLSRRHVAYGWPHALPGGEAALITLWRDTAVLANAELGIVDLKDGDVTELGLAGTNPRYLPANHLIFGRVDGSVAAVPFSVRQRRLTGRAVAVLEGVVVKTGGAVDLAFSPNGTLLYKEGEAESRRLVRVDRSGVETELEAGGSRAFSFPRISPDGRLVAVSISSDIWIYDIGSTALSRLTSGGRSWKPEWYPDGRRIAFATPGQTGVETITPIRSQAWDGSGEAVDILVGHPSLELSFGREGTYAAIKMGLGRDWGGDDADIWIAPMDSLQSLRPFLATGADEILPRISPDGSVLAYTSDDTGVKEVYIRAVPDGSGRVPVSIGGGQEPVWSSSGDELFYRSPTHLTAATVTRSPELAVTKRERLFADRYMTDNRRAQYDVFPNGREFVMVRSGVPDGDLVAVINWDEKVRRLFPD